MLRVHEVTKQFGSLTAVDEVTFTVGEGELFALLGPNGSGKTTLAKLIAGLLRPSSGDVFIGDASMRSAPQVAKFRLGYIPDDPVAWGSMTGFEFLMFTGALYQIGVEKRKRKIAELLPHFNLESIQHVPFAQYSRGNRQKFTILAALLHAPDVLLIDEPIVGLDPDSVGVFENLLREYKAKGGVIVLTTHTLDVAERLADRIGILQAGKLVAAESLAALRSQAGCGEQASIHEVYHALVPTSTTASTPVATD
jgi:ABC-2 type transport system ATP-binding protein